MSKQKDDIKQPNSWAFVSVGDIAEARAGFGFPTHLQGQPTGDYPFAKVGDISKSVKQGKWKIGSAGNYLNKPEVEKLKAHPLPYGSTIFAKIGEAIRQNYRAITTCEMLVDNNVMGLVPRKSIVTPMFLFYFMQTIDLYQLAGATTVPSVRKSEIEAIEIPIPPFAEQVRIAAKLEELFARADACRKRLEQVPRLLKQFRQSVLAAACSGRLTADWRPTELNGSSSAGFLQRVKEERSRILKAQGKKGSKLIEVDLTLSNELPSEWSLATVDQLSTKVVDGVHRKPDYVQAGIPFLTVRNLTVGSGISFDRTSFVTEKDHLEFFKRANPESGDLLITKDGTLGVVRLIQTDRVFSIFVSLAMIKPVVRSFGPYLALALSAPQVQQNIVKTGTGLQHIHLRDLRAVAVPIPPEPEQQEIVRRVEALFKIADAVETHYRNAQEQLEKLPQSILAKAFRGELVPQDPADEPASALIERMRADRLGQSLVDARPQGRKRRSKPADAVPELS